VKATVALLGPVSRTNSNSWVAASLVFAVFVWGGNNVGVKHLVVGWPPIFVGCTRFLFVGILLLSLLRWTSWLGKPARLTPALNRDLWIRGGTSLAVYIVTFNWALRYTPASHIALHLGASPIWALLWEGIPALNTRSLQRYLAAGLATCGVVVLFLPELRAGTGAWFGELLGFLASVLWTNYGRQCRRFTTTLTGLELTGHTMWRAGVLLAPLALVEWARAGVVWRADYVWIQIYCILGGGVVAFGVWNHALRRWPTSQVYLFNNLIPLSTMGWAHVCLGEPVTRTFWVAMVLIAGGVVLGQTDLKRILGGRWQPAE
jgi:O-acetylserine/cysteine efflux transporter